MHVPNKTRIQTQTSRKCVLGTAQRIAIDITKHNIKGLHTYHYRPSKEPEIKTKRTAVKTKRKKKSPAAHSHRFHEAPRFTGRARVRSPPERRLVRRRRRALRPPEVARHKRRSRFEGRSQHRRRRTVGTPRNGGEYSPAPAPAPNRADRAAAAAAIAAGVSGGQVAVGAVAAAISVLSFSP